MDPATGHAAPGATAASPLRPEKLTAGDARLALEPFPWMVASGLIDEAARIGLRTGFPETAESGFVPHAAAACGAEFNRLVAAVVEPGFADAIGERLGVPDLSAHPVLVTVCSRLNKRHGTIHTDSRSKVASALLYLNEDWKPGAGGCLRLLAKDDDIESLLTPEIPPLFGTLVAFRRTDRSFHGHLPFEGERRVIQFAWLTDRDALERKSRRGRMQRALKRLAGPLDRWFGARRDVNKAHRD